MSATPDLAAARLALSLAVAFCKFCVAAVACVMLLAIVL
jgi:hypothetical protein